MRHEFTAVYERDDEWVIACCPEVPGANGQGHTKDEARASLTEAIVLILEDRAKRGCVGYRRVLSARSSRSMCRRRETERLAPPPARALSNPRIQPTGRVGAWLRADGILRRCAKERRVVRRGLEACS
jgi:predicted RNase H-like HicB family nuclease